MSVSNVSQLASNLGQSLAVRIDDVSPLIYIGTAPMNSADTDPVWSIKLLSTTGSVMSILWANGNDLNTNIWNNRASLSYS